MLYLMVGLPCSGKTTRAKALGAATGALRLTPDAWHTRLFGGEFPHPDHDRRHGEIEALMWEVAAALLERGADVILDFGFWSRAERVDFATRAHALGASCVIDYEPVPFPEIERRLARRNAIAGAQHFIIPLDLWRQWAAIFEPPDAAELALVSRGSFPSDNP